MANETKDTENTVNETVKDTGEKPQEEKTEKTSGKTAGKKEKKKSDAKDKEIAKLKEDIEALNDKHLRLVAEYDNFRKRTVKEKEAIYGDSKSDIVGKILPVLDNFERAAAAQSDLENYKKGIEMTVKQLMDVLAGIGVEPFGEAGEEFDPNMHNGVMHIDDETLGENVIADVFMKGYKMGDRVIRCATVKVAN